MTLRFAVTAAGVGALLGTLVTAIGVSDATPLGYGHIHVATAVRTAAAVTALFTSCLFIDRFLRTRRLDFLLFSSGLAVLAGADLFLAAVPRAAHEAVELSNWGALIARCGGDLLVASAAFAPPRLLRHPTRALVLALFSSALFVAVAGIIAHTFAIALPTAAEPTSRGAPTTFAFDAESVLFAAQLLAVLAYAAAAIAFIRRVPRERDSFLGWLGVAVTVAAFAEVDYLLYPSIYSDVLSMGDVVRLLFYVVLLLAAFDELGCHWRRMADAAAARERLRIARDVHDGIAQELAYIVRDAGVLQLPQPVVAAARRALEETHLLVREGRLGAEDPVAVALARSTEDVAERFGARIKIDAPTEASVPNDVGDVLVRVAREAVVNATRHGHAKRIHVSLLYGSDVRLSIRDDGDGFSPSAVDGTGFGLTSMRQRVESIGGHLTVRSTVGRGTEIEAVVP